MLTQHPYQVPAAPPPPFNCNMGILTFNVTRNNCILLPPYCYTRQKVGPS